MADKFENGYLEACGRGDLASVMFWLWYCALVYGTASDSAGLSLTLCALQIYLLTYCDGALLSNLVEIRWQMWHFCFLDVLRVKWDLRQRALVFVTCVLHRWDSWSFPKRGQNMATAASPFKDLASGTVFLLSWELQTFQWLFLETNLKFICLIPL